jgi:hypothetical protein
MRSANFTQSHSKSPSSDSSASPSMMPSVSSAPSEEYLPSASPSISTEPSPSASSSSSLWSIEISFTLVAPRGSFYPIYMEAGSLEATASHYYNEFIDFYSSAILNDYDSLSDVLNHELIHADLVTSEVSGILGVFDADSSSSFNLSTLN